MQNQRPPAGAVGTRDAAGSEAIAHEQLSQSETRVSSSPTADNAVSHTRNGLQLLQLLRDTIDYEQLETARIRSTLANEFRTAIDDAIARFTFALELMERPAPAPSSLPVRLLPWCPMNVRQRLLATSALGFNPRTGDECVQLTIVCPPLVAGGHEYLEQLQTVGRDFLHAIVSDRVDVLDEDAAQAAIDAIAAIGED